MLQEEVDRLETEINSNNLFEEFMRVKLGDQLYKMKMKEVTDQPLEESEIQLNKYLQLFDKVDAQDFEEFLIQKSKEME